MRIIFFNIWHGKVWDELKSFVENHVSDTDIFCFTEVHPDLHAKWTEILADYQPFYEEIARGNYENFDVDGQSIFVKNGIKVLDSGKKYLYKVSKDDTGALQHVDVEFEDKNLFIGSIHGKARPGTKQDTPIRIKQSKAIIDFFKDKPGLTIFGGDFNLYPETKSIKMIEDAGYRNLIKEFNIDSTRNRLSWEQFNNIQHWADYAFVSKDVKVSGFEVPKVEISDHLPLILDLKI